MNFPKSLNFGQVMAVAAIAYQQRAIARELWHSGQQLTPHGWEVVAVMEAGKATMTVDYEDLRKADHILIKWADGPAARCKYNKVLHEDRFEAQ